MPPDVAEDRKGWLFRTSRGHDGAVLSKRPMSQPDAWRMIRRRAAAAGIAVGLAGIVLLVRPGGEGAGLGLAITREIMRIHEFTVARCASTTMSVAAPSLPSIFKSGPATWKNSENLPSTKLSPPRCAILFAQPAGLVERRCDSLEVCALQQGDERHRTAFLDVRHHAHCPKTRVRLNNLGRCRQQG